LEEKYSNGSLVNPELQRSCKEFSELWHLTPATMASVLSRGRWQFAPHLELISLKILEVFTGRLRVLIIELPPRHGKSELCSRWAPVWWLAHRGTDTVLLVSYNEELAANMGRRARDTITVHARELGICISRDTFSATDWKLRGEEGRMLSTGVGGSLTGHGGNLIVVDDLIKNDEEARSKTARDHLWEFFRRTLYTRLEPGGGLIVVGTRWHYDDYIGRLKALLAQTPTNAAGADLFDDTLKLQGANVKRKQRAQIASHCSLAGLALEQVLDRLRKHGAARILCCPGGDGSSE